MRTWSSPFPEEMATEKQIAFAKSISVELGVELPNENTKKAYGEFISEYLDVLYEQADYEW